MIRRTRWISFGAVALGWGLAHAQQVDFTGTVLVDFPNAVEGVDRAIDPGRVDVGLPDGLADAVSGYDIDEVRISYHRASDTLFVGIQTFGIAGDVDGDGDPSATDPRLAELGGRDVPDFGPPESFAFMIDVDEDGAPDIIAGVPFLSSTDDFMVAEFFGGPNAALAPGAAFGAPYPGGGFLFASPSPMRPHLEFTIESFSEKMVVEGDLSQRFGVAVYMGSAADAVGEDFLPGSPVDGNGGAGDGNGGNGNGNGGNGNGGNGNGDGLGDGGLPTISLCPEEWQLAEETCDGFDEDCDLVIDEDPNFQLPPECDTELFGICAIGVPACIEGEETCMPVIRPGDQAEVCDRLDNDCDDAVDEGPIEGVGDACVLPDEVLAAANACAGVTVCSEGGIVCAPGEAFPQLGEICGDIAGAGLCQTIWRCGVGGQPECQQPDSMPELCDGFDNDCDGQIDEDFPTLGDACTTDLGVCSNDGVNVCTDDGTGVECNAPAPTPLDDVGDCERQGDMLDNDCDGRVDEDRGGPDSVLCPTSCRDGVLDDGEECDDGNDINDDGCNNLCQRCGNGTCDDGETALNCEADCTECGDGVVSGDEQCDDGNDNNVDGCRNNCQICPIDPETGVCPSVCGDGIVDPPELCDDGNTQDGDSCPADCGVPGDGPVCGDGVIEAPETCDDGNLVDGDGCNANCNQCNNDGICDPGEDPLTCGDCAECRNGILEAGEACDDGNQIDDDECTNMCALGEDRTPRLTGADLADNCSTTRPTERAPWWLAVFGLALVATRRRR